MNLRQTTLSLSLLVCSGLCASESRVDASEVNEAETAPQEVYDESEVRSLIHWKEVTEQLEGYGGEETDDEGRWCTGWSGREEDWAGWMGKLDVLIECSELVLRRRLLQACLADVKGCRKWVREPGKSSVLERERTKFDF